jgi:hypothetical protein
MFVDPSTLSKNGYLYFVTFIDHAARYVSIVFLWKKSEVLKAFQDYVAFFKTKHGKTPKTVRSDNGGEYVSARFQDFCQTEGIRQELTTPYSPQQNGVAERMSRTIMEMASSMLHHADAPMEFWEYAVHTAVVIRNMLPTTAIPNKTPFEIWNGRKPNLEILRVFGCEAFVWVPNAKRKKLDPKAIPCKFIGYDTHRKAYRFWDGEQKKVIVSRDAKFNEDFAVAVKRPFDSPTSTLLSNNSVLFEFGTLPFFSGR